MFHEMPSFRFCSLSSSLDVAYIDLSVIYINITIFPRKIMMHFTSVTSILIWFWFKITFLFHYTSFEFLLRVIDKTHIHWLRDKWYNLCGYWSDQKYLCSKMYKQWESCTFVYKVLHCLHLICLDA